MRFEQIPNFAEIVIKDNGQRYRFVKYDTKMLCKQSFLITYCKRSELTEEERAKRNCRNYGSNYFGSSNLRKVLNGEGGYDAGRLIRNLSRFCEKQIYEVENSKGFIRKHGKIERFLTIATLPDRDICERFELYGCPINEKSNDEYSVRAYNFCWGYGLGYTKYKACESRYYRFLVEPRRDIEFNRVRDRFDPDLVSYELEL